MQTKGNKKTHIPLEIIESLLGSCCRYIFERLNTLNSVKGVYVFSTNHVHVIIPLSLVYQSLTNRQSINVLSSDSVIHSFNVSVATLRCIALSFFNPVPGSEMTTSVFTNLAEQLSLTLNLFFCLNVNNGWPSVLIVYLIEQYLI